jgi:hypothetical protein
VIRKDEVRGWGATGFPDDASRALRSRAAGIAEGWLGRVIGSELPIFEPDAAGVCPAYGQPTPAESVGMAIRVRDRALGVVVVERQAGEVPWHPALVGVLGRVAQLQLELDVLRRKVGGAEPPAPAAAAAPRTSKAASPTCPPIDDPSLEAARRFARLVATDIRLYNEEAVVTGRRQRDLADRLADPLGRGKDAFLKRHGALGPTAVEILRAAYVEVLAAGDDSLLPRLD